MNNVPVIFLFNSPIASGCDYVTQTMRLVAKKHPSFGLALGDIIFFPKLFTEREPWAVRSLRGSIIIRPISVLPGVRFRWVRMATYMIYALFLSLFMVLRYFGSKRVVWFFEPFHIPALLPIFSGFTKIYDCVDYYPAFNQRAKSEHTTLLRVATSVYANSAPLAKAIRVIRDDVVTVPLGFAETEFERARVLTVPPRKTPFTVGYIGSISSRIDFPLLTRTVKKLRDVQFLFFGSIEPDVFGRKDNTYDAFQSILRCSNVQWIPSISKASIPSVLARTDVGIIPYRIDNDFNRYSFPMKVMEYFAAGRPVVSTDIYSLRQFAKAGVLTIAPEFAQAIVYIRNNGWSREKQKQQRAFAIKHSWKNKIHAIMRRM